MGEQRNLTEENVSELTKHLKRMQEDNPYLKYRFFDQDREESEIEKLRTELEEIKRRPHVNNPFRWMQNWLEAYARQNDGIKSVGDVMEWIFQQPMSGG